MMIRRRRCLGKEDEDRVGDEMLMLKKEDKCVPDEDVGAIDVDRVS